MLRSMWQMIRHANQEEAAVESLIIVPVSHKGTSPPCTDPPKASFPLHIHPHSPSARIYPDRQTDGPEAGALRGEFVENKLAWLLHLQWSVSLGESSSINCKTDVVFNIWPTAHWLLCGCADS